MADTQRYRVNYRLLIGLGVGLLVAAPSAYGLWRFQVSRNANWLLEKAQAAEKSKDELEAYESLKQYTRLRRDDTDALVRLGEVAEKIAKDDDQPGEVRGEAFQVLVDAVLRSDDDNLRRKLVDVYAEFGYPDRALTAIDEILSESEGDPELKALKAQCLFANQRPAEGANYCYKLVGYDRKTGEFDPKAAEAPDQPVAYFLLAQYLVNDGKQELAREMVDQLIAVNRESRDAYIMRYQVLKSSGDNEGALESLEKAYEIDPEHDGVLLTKGIEEIYAYQTTLSGGQSTKGEGENDEQVVNIDEAREKANAHLDAAGKFFAEGLRKHPDNITFFEQAARVELMRNRKEQALKFINDGLKKFDLRTELNASGIPKAIELMNFRIELLLAEDNYDGAKQAIKELRDLDNPQVVPLADYHEARIQLQRQNWWEAAQQFSQVKIRLLRYPNLQAMAGASEGVCYAQLGQHDRAVQAYRWALQRNPELPQAKFGLEEALMKIGQGPAEGDPGQLDRLIKDMLALPTEQQNWEALEQRLDELVAEQAKLRPLSQAWVDARKQLLRAQVYASRATASKDENQKKELFKQARTAIQKAYNLTPNETGIQLAAVRLLGFEPQNGPTNALKLLDQIIAKQKETPAFRTLRAELLLLRRDENVLADLAKITEDVDQFPADGQAKIWATVAACYEQLGKAQEAIAAMQRAADIAPNVLQYRTTLFELGRKLNDEAAMVAAQEKILEVVKDKSNPTYVLTEVQRRIHESRIEVNEDSLREARRMLNAAIKERSTWADLYLASGQLYLVFEKKPELALRAFEQALENGPANYSALNLQVRLLADLGRFPEARETMDRIPRDMWASLLERAGPIVLQKTGETQEAFELAKSVAEARPTDPAIQIWFSEIAMAADKAAEAEAAIKKAIEINPVDPDMWSSLLGFYMKQEQGDKIEVTLREAQLALDEEFLPLLMAKQHELYGRWAQAETILLSYYGDEIKAPNASRRMAEFYLMWAEYEKARVQRAAREGQRTVDMGGLPRGKARTYLNNLLRAANEGEVEKDDARVAWARRQGARLLSQTGDYQDSIKAERLLEAAVGQTPSAEDQGLLVEILNRRGDPASRERAVAVLREMQKQGSLSAERDLQLARALYDLGDWAACQQHLQSAIARHPSNGNLRLTLISMFIDKGDYAAAERWLDLLGDSKEIAAVGREFRVRLAAARGDKEKARELLRAMTPNIAGTVTPQQLQLVRGVAILAENVEDYEFALQLMREYARRTGGSEFELARMVSLHGDIDEGLTMLKQVFPTAMDEVMRLAIDMLRARRAEAPEKLEAEIGRIVRQARRDDPESARRMVLEAEMLEVLEKYDESVAAYRELLARDDVPKLIRATALNNYAFLLTLKNTELDVALSSVNQAIELIGPISDILDTRGIVYKARGEFDNALEDLKNAVKVGRTASKYFHLTAAALAAGDKKTAVEAWRQAEVMGIGPEKVSKLEIEELKKVADQMGGMQSAKL